MLFEVYIYVYGLKNFILFYLNVFNEIEYILVVYVNVCVMCIMNFNFVFLNCLVNYYIYIWYVWKRIIIFKIIDDEKRLWFFNFLELL